MKIVAPFVIAFILAGCHDTPQSEPAQLKTENQQNHLSSPALYAKANTYLDNGELHAAKAALQMAIDQGDIPSKELLGVLLLNDDNRIDRLKGFQLITDAADTNWSSAQFYLGSCLYSGGCGLPENKSLSLYWLRRALDNGETGAKMMIGFIEEELGHIDITNDEFRKNQRWVEQQLKTAPLS